VIAASGEPLPDAVVQLISANPVAVPRVAITGAKGTVAFSDVPSGSLHVAASARGFATSAIRVSAPGLEVRFTLAPAYRVTATVALPAAAGPHFVRLLDDTNASMDSVLDGQSDRRIDPPGRLAIGPLPWGTYVLELDGAGGRRRERIRIVDRDVAATFRLFRSTAAFRP
jgi:hypothetical protein